MLDDTDYPWAALIYQHAAREQDKRIADALSDNNENNQDAEGSEDEDAGGWRWTPVYVCTDPTAHGHHPRWPATTRPTRKPVDQMTDQEREAARAERRDVIESNKAWDSATTVRRDWLRGYLARKTAPKGTASFLAASAAHDPDTLAGIDGNHLAADLPGTGEALTYGRSHTLTAMIETAGDARAQVIHLALTLAAYEAATIRDDWRTPNPRTRRYLTHLAAIGYTLSQVEQRATGNGTESTDPDAG